MKMKYRSLIDKINPIFFALTTMAIQYWLSAWKRGELRVQLDIGPEGGEQYKCDT